MRLDYDCVRDLLLAIENRTQLNSSYNPKDILFRNFLNDLSDKYRPEDVVYSAMKLEEAGFITVRNDSVKNFNIDSYYVEDITFSGHEYLNSVRDNATWTKIRKNLKTLTFTAIQAAANAYAISALGK